MTADTISREIRPQITQITSPFRFSAPTSSAADLFRKLIAPVWHLGPTAEESVPTAPRNVYELVKPATVEHRTFLTYVPQDAEIIIHLTEPMTPTMKLKANKVGGAVGFERRLGRLNYLRTLADGWFGEGSRGADEATGREAEALLRRLYAEAPKSPLPVLGLDTDGTIVMSWSQEGLAGSMTVYGDGTYSYCVRRGGMVAKQAEARIGEPVAVNLVRLLEA